MKIGSVILAAFVLTCCAPTDLQSSGQTDLSEKQLRATSCSRDTQRYDPPPLSLKVKNVPLGTDADIARALPKNMNFIGGWHLTSNDSNFGGLSGLAVLESGDLLSVSDKGYVVTLGLSGSIPNGQATMMPLSNAKGKVLTGKIDGDAEGLTYREGLAFVSFERRHRILAFDFGRCGGAAKGQYFSGLPKEKLGARIATNSGAEALDFAPDGRVRAGYETVINKRAPLVIFDADGIVREDPIFLDIEDGFKLVGADAGYQLFRSYDRVKGNRNIIRGPNLEAHLSPPLAVDNFEGLAVAPQTGGETYIYIISDDNFSAKQRTLLYLFAINAVDKN